MQCTSVFSFFQGPVESQSTCGILELRIAFRFLSPMTFLRLNPWEAAAGVALVACATAGAVWWMRRRRPTAEEIERARRALLAHTGRLVDGMLLDICEMEAEDGRKLTMLVYNYRIGGVDYECSQDITLLNEIANPPEIRLGFPCTVRYHQGNPQNSIVVAEGWTGLRANLPEFPSFGAGKTAKMQSSSSLSH